MKSIGIRELRQHASRHLRRVERGETIEVTDRGQPIAHLVPVPAAEGIEALRRAGRLAEPSGDLGDLGPPLTPGPRVPLPSAALAAARADER